MSQNADEHLVAARFPFPKIVQRFMEKEASGGIVIIIATILALIAANSAFAPAYLAFINTEISVGVKAHIYAQPLHLWVKEILMVLFFLLVGLELKREMTEGILTKRAQILLPLCAALAGMIAPAIVFVAFNLSALQNFNGWAIPTATDIAFALAVLLLAGRNIPASIKIFLLAIAIFDDLGAILVIAIFYSGNLSLGALFFVGLGVLLLFLLNRLHVAVITPYLLIGFYLIISLHEAGIHTTIAGVLAGLFMPMRVTGRGGDVEVSEAAPIIEGPQMQHSSPRLSPSGHSPVNQCIHFLHPWVSYLILPLFAFVSAGLSFKGLSWSALFMPLPLGIAMALFFGKQIGIFGISFALIKARIIAMPEGATWLQIYGVSVLAGIGFTISLLIGTLAFPDSLQDQVKIGVIAGSLLSALWGAVILKYAALGQHRQD